MAAFLVSTAHAADTAKIVFISGSPSHGRMSHEHRAGNMILAKALNDSGLDVNAVLVPHYGYPEDAGILTNAATVVIFCTGHRGHVLNKHLDVFSELYTNMVDAGEIPGDFGIRCTGCHSNDG